MILCVTEKAGVQPSGRQVFDPPIVFILPLAGVTLLVFGVLIGVSEDLVEK